MTLSLPNHKLQTTLLIWNSLYHSRLPWSFVLFCHQYHCYKRGITWRFGMWRTQRMLLQYVWPETKTKVLFLCVCMYERQLDIEKKQGERKERIGRLTIACQVSACTLYTFNIRPQCFSSLKHGISPGPFPNIFHLVSMPWRKTCFQWATLSLN